ncbi:conserved protein of unknown function precursor containing a type A C-terminal secretion signal [Tenacibaculum sp. 190524A02b]|uniref:T9SS type A sorting domain-containing protein n=1 Tax=Tenacibaculum vairaonense TaxID=3137860 RepID=UPI0032B15AC1
MKHKLLVVCLLFNYVLFAQTFTRDYSNGTTVYQIKMNFQKQSWGDVYLDVDVTNKGASNINVRNAKVTFLSDATPSLVNFFPNGKISYPTISLTQTPEGSQQKNSLTIGLADESWVDDLLGVDESFKFRVDLKTVNATYESIADSVRFFLENEEPSQFVNVTTNITGNDGNSVTVNYKNIVLNTTVTETTSTSATNSLRINQEHQVWSNDFVIGTTKYASQYPETSPLSFTPTENNTIITLPYTKSTIATANVIINVRNLPSGANATLTLKNKTIDGANKTQSIANGNTTIDNVLVGNYTIEGSTYTLGDKAYIPEFTSSTINVTTSGTNTITIVYKEIIITDFNVKGFPKYLSHGTITSASELIDDNFKNSPLNVIFKYSGLDGAGDRGGIPDMTPTVNTIEQARRLEASPSQGGRKILPVMVHYTANASGGGSLEAIKDLEGENLYYHYRNLVQEIKVMLSYEDEAHPNPGAFVISPDLIGAIQQDVVFGNDHDIRTMFIDVNDEVRRAFTDENLSTTAIPTFTNDLKGYFQSVNFVIHHVGECKIPFGYQQNVWAAGSARWVFEGAGEFNSPVDEAIEVATFMNELAMYTGDWKPDFIAFDRYERDCFGPAAIQNYAWTAKHWDKYLVFCKEIAERIGNVPIMLWQIPGGHMATNDEVIVNYKLDQNSSASAPFFLGDDRIGTNINAIKAEVRNIPLTLAHYQANSVGELLANDDGYDWSKSNLQRLADMNVFSILWGGGSTTGVASIVNNGDDDGWLANKIKTYYENDVIRKRVVIPPYQEAPFCQNGGVIGETKAPLEVKLFPNPTKDYIQVISDNKGELEITIMDMLGNILKEVKKEHAKNVNIENLPSGMYLIKVKDKNNKQKSTSKIFYKE